MQACRRSHHRFAGVAVGYRIAVAAIAQRAVFGLATVFHVAGVVGGLLVNAQQPLLPNTVVRHFSRGGMHLMIHFFHPGVRLAVQIAERLEVDAGPEILFDKTDGRLDLTHDKHNAPMRLGPRHVSAILPV